MIKKIKQRKSKQPETVENLKRPLKNKPKLTKPSTTNTALFTDEYKIDNNEIYALIENWKLSITTTQTNLLQLAVKAYAAVDGLMHSNENLRSSLNMKDAEIDTNLTIELVSKLFKLESANYFISSSSLPLWLQKQVLTNLANKEFPPLNLTKPNILTPNFERKPQKELKKPSSKSTT